MVIDDTSHKVTNCLMFGTWGSLTLDVTIYLYLITPFFFSIIYFTLGSTRERDHQEGPGAVIPQRLATATV